MQIVLEVEHLNKSFQTAAGQLDILSDINFTISKGEVVSIVGPSGSGKTTLLGLLAGLDYPSSGDVKIDNQSLSKLNQDQLARLRNEKVGFVFQNFQLLPTLTALENVMVPLELKKQKNAFEKASDLLEKVGLNNRLNHYPKQLSGGEQQRVAIARAFATEPIILFADEPTGNLDEDTSIKIEALLFELNAQFNTTLILVTHDLDLASRTQKILHIKGGKLINQEVVMPKID